MVNPYRQLPTATRWMITKHRVYTPKDDIFDLLLIIGLKCVVAEFVLVLSKLKANLNFLANSCVTQSATLFGL